MEGEGKGLPRTAGKKGLRIAWEKGLRIAREKGLRIAKKKELRGEGRETRSGYRRRERKNRIPEARNGIGCGSEMRGNMVAEKSREIRYVWKKCDEGYRGGGTINYG